MKITFPYMGSSHIAFKALINGLGHQAIVPPKPSRKTLTLGTRYSPEFACLPFKILLGSYLEAIEKGAELIITAGGSGPCRAGYYGILHQRILADLGYQVPIMVMESIYQHPWDFAKKVKSILSPNKISWLRFSREFRQGWEKLKALDQLEQLSHQIRPYEMIKGQTTKAYELGLKYVDEAKTIPQILDALQHGLKLLREVPQDRNKQVLRIGIVGEIYVVIEPFANLDIQTTLGEMGVETQRAIYLSGWTKEETPGLGGSEVEGWAEPYLKELIGGHGINSIGETVNFARKGFQGVIQLAPFTCIPEIVVKSIMPQISKDLGIHILTVFLDEQTGKAGLQTRLEAFVEMLWQKELQNGGPVV